MKVQVNARLLNNIHYLPILTYIDLLLFLLRQLVTTVAAPTLVGRTTGCLFGSGLILLTLGLGVLLGLWGRRLILSDLGCSICLALRGKDHRISFLINIRKTFNHFVLFPYLIDLLYLLLVS